VNPATPDPSPIPSAVDPMDTPCTGSTVAPDERALAWDLRGAWAARREVVIVLLDATQVRGYVEHVAPAGGFALVWDRAGILHVPISRVLSVRSTHFHQDGQPVPPPPPRVIFTPAPPGQLAFDLNDQRIVEPSVVSRTRRLRSVS
jgi:hypothetical protein